MLEAEAVASTQETWKPEESQPMYFTIPTLWLLAMKEIKALNISKATRANL